MRRFFVLAALLTGLAVPIGARPAAAGGPLVEVEVTTAADVVDAGDGLTSLREAFDQAEDDAAITRIILDTVTYHLGCAHGQLVHDSAEPLVLVGNGATIEQTCAGQSIIQDLGPVLTLEALTLTGGSSPSLAAIEANVADFVEVTIEANTGAGGLKLWAEGVTSLVVDSVIRQNTSTALGGAGIYSFGDLDLVGTIVSGNISTALFNGVGGVSAGNLDLIDSTIGPGNEGEIGGMSAAFSMQIRLSTVVGNVATGSGGGALSWGDLDVENSAVVANSAVQSGGLRSLGLLTMDHATVVDNEAPSAANILTTGGLDLRGSIVAHPRGGGNSCEVFAGGFTSRGHNLLDPVEAPCTDPSSTTDISGDPFLGPLRDNGPTVETLFPLAGSPLVDAIPAAECTSDIDQRDIARPFGPACDIGAVEQVYPPHGFPDVRPWVEDAVRWITSTVNDPPIMTGFDNGRFGPAKNMTRAQIVRLLYREAGSPAVSGYPPHGLSGVPAWVGRAVRWAKGENIVTGYDDGTFRAQRPVTRAQVVRMKYRLAGSPDVSGLPAHGFSDARPWFEDALRWAANVDNPLPLVTGWDDGTFRPRRSITRAQVVRMDYRLALTPQAWDNPDGAPATVPFQSQD